MEKNIKKRVCWLAAVMSAVLVVLFGYWFFLNPHGYWQKQKEAEKNEYMEKQMLWRKSEKMPMQQMLSDMTLMAKGGFGPGLLANWSLASRLSGLHSWHSATAGDDWYLKGYDEEL